MDTLIHHFALNDDRDMELKDEDILASLFSVLGYSVQSIEFAS